MRTRLLVGSMAFASLVGCARSQTAIGSPSSESPLPVSSVSACSSSSSRVRSLSTSDGATAGTVSGRVLRLSDRRPIEGAVVRLLEDSTRTLLTDSLGRFRFESVPEGQNRVQVRQLGFNALNEAITVPPLEGREIEVGLAVAPDIWACENERLLAQSPPLTLLRPDSVTVHQTLANGAQLRHTLVALPGGDWIRFNSRIANVGHLPAMVVTLCGPTATASILIDLVGVFTCSGAQRSLAPGDTLIVTFSKPLRGTPGRYRFDVRPIHRPALDAHIELEFVAWKRPP